MNYRFDPISLFRAVRRFDQRRPGVPGEHWAVGTVGTALMALSSRSRSPALKVGALLVGGLLMWRAASGRDGIAKLRR